MENKKYCAKCNEEFEEGEIIGFTDDKAYHCIFEGRGEFSGCADAIPEAGICYKGKIYNMFDVVKLKNLKEIKAKKTGHGFKLEGSLDDLLN